MSVVLLVQGLATGEKHWAAGQYVADFDFEADDMQPSAFTISPTKAKHFPDMIAALEYWKTIRLRYGGFRKDGKPDRPLTAFTVSIIQSSEAV